MLLRFDPFRELDRAAEQMWNRTQTLPMDAVRRGNHVLVHLDLPGVDPDAIELTVERNVLTVRAERSFDRGEEDEILSSERRYGTFTRQLLLGDTLDADDIEADYEQGVLVLRIPIAETAKPRRVSVGSGQGDGPRQIQTEAS